MGYNEADTRAKLIDPAIHRRGWSEDLIRREETAGAIDIIGGKGQRRAKGKIDYVLRVMANPRTQPVAMALIEAKKEDLPPGHGLNQAKGYAHCKRLQVPFVFSSNGHQFVEFDKFSGLTSKPKPMSELGWGMRPRTRQDRTQAFTYKHEEWLLKMPEKSGTTIRAVASQFERGGTEGLENPQIFQTPEVKAAGGLDALQEIGKPADLLK